MNPNPPDNPMPANETVAPAVRHLEIKAALLLLFCASLLKLSAQSYSPFLYFQF